MAAPHWTNARAAGLFFLAGRTPEWGIDVAVCQAGSVPWEDTLPSNPHNHEKEKRDAE